MSLRLLLPILVGVAIRMAVVVAFPNMELHGDEQTFMKGAADILETGDTPYFPFRPPLYLWYAAAIFEFTDQNLNALRYSQAILEGLSILGIGLLAQRTLGEKVAPWAAWAYALFPDYIVYSHYLWSESLMLLTMVYGLLALVFFRERPTLGRAVLVGLAWGVSDLVKPYHFYMLPILLAWLVWSLAKEQRIAAVQGAVLAVVTAFLIVLPWSIHISEKENRIILISTTGELNLKTGVSFIPPPQSDFANHWRGLHRRLKGRTNMRDVGLISFILENPSFYLGRAVIKWSYLWSPNSFLLRNIYRGDRDGKQPKYGPPQEMNKVLRLGAVYATMGATAFATLCMLLGVFTARDPVMKGLTAIYVVTYCAMITLTPVLSRYRLPMMVFGVVYVGAVLSREVRVRDLKGHPWAIFGACMGMLGLLGLWYMRLPDIIARAY